MYWLEMNIKVPAMFVVFGLTGTSILASDKTGYR